MKRWMLSPLAVLVLWPANLAAQEEEASPTWWAVFSEQVAPANVAAFEANSAAMFAVIKATAPADMVYFTSSGPETGYTYAIPMQGMDDFMKLNEQWMGMVNKIGWERWKEMSGASDGLVDHTTLNFYVEMPDHSYHPAGFADSFEVKPVRHYDYLYPIPGMEDEFNEVMTEWVALYQAQGIESGWTAYQAVSGTDLPMVVLITPAESAGAYYMMSDAVDEMLGEAGQELMMKSLALMRKFEHNEATFRPDLSLVPEGM
jgi:hypothetical protein